MDKTQIEHSEKCSNFEQSSKLGLQQTALANGRSIKSSDFSKDSILQQLETHNLFLTGGAGVGKSYLTNEVIEHYHNTKRGVIALGSTGVSAVNIGGMTIHSFFGFGIASSLEELNKYDKYAKKRLAELKKILKATELIIIDEISMVSSDLLDMIAYRLKSSGYLGKLMVVGDFFQIPPIRQNERNDIFGERLYAFESMAWERFEFFVVVLDQMKRTKDTHFTNILSKVRCGVCDDEVENYLDRLSQNSLAEPNPTYLFGRNAEVEEMNRLKIDALKSDETILFAQLQQFGEVPQKRLDSWRSSLPVLDQLTLKEGVPVLFTVNKWGKYVNGERGVLHKIEEEYLLIEKEESFVRVERHDFDLIHIEVDNDKTKNITLATLSQFPIKLAYAVTIHKSQGMSIDHLVCNVDNIFTPSQFYVAISRATNPHHLKIDFSKGELRHYLKRLIRVDERVVSYYQKIDSR